MAVVILHIYYDCILLALPIDEKIKCSSPKMTALMPAPTNRPNDVNSVVMVSCGKGSPPKTIVTLVSIEIIYCVNSDLV